MRELTSNIALALISTLMSVAVLELAARIYGSEFRITNFVLEARQQQRAAYPATFSDSLGWIPEPGEHRVKHWNTTVTIEKNRTRSNGNPKRYPADDAILVVGDSFAFGDEVSDYETWPAQLERLLGRKIINGGVFGYGVDQSFIRMQQLVRPPVPTAIVFSFIYDDINRAELSMRGGAKPYFTLSDQKLVLHDTHLKGNRAGKQPVAASKKILGYSFLVHKLFLRLNRGWWLSRSPIRVHTDGLAIGCAIFRKFGQIAKVRKIDAIVLMQWTSSTLEKHRSETAKLSSCAEQSRIQFIDLHDDLLQIRKSDPERFASFYATRAGHMSPKGNLFVAEQLLKVLEPLAGRPSR